MFSYIGYLYLNIFCDRFPGFSYKNQFIFKLERLERVEKLTPHEVSWTPLLWAMKLLARAKADNKVKIESPAYANLQASFEQIENVNRKLLRYAWVNFPHADRKSVV